MLRVEFHCHTVYSKDSLTSPEVLVNTCRKKGIDRVVVTDHNTTAGAIRAKEIDPVRVIVGEEIMTTKGEILAAFVTEEVPPFLSPEETIRILRAQGAYISVSHPFDIHRNGHWQEDDLLAILPLIDAIETFNARCFLASHNQHAQEFAEQHQLPGTAGSDAHAAFELGKVVMILPEFHDADSLKNSMQQVKFEGSLSAPWVHLTSRYAVFYKKVFSVVK